MLNSCRNLNKLQLYLERMLKTNKDIAKNAIPFSRIELFQTAHAKTDARDSQFDVHSRIG